MDHPAARQARDTREALEAPLPALGLNWIVEQRTGDTTASLRGKQARKLPTALVTTPESFSLLLSYPDAREKFATLECVIVDEWHELLGSKRGVMTELALARLRCWRPRLRVWGLSATLGNIDAAMAALLGDGAGRGRLVRGLTPRTIDIESIIPDAIERFPRAGHLGLNLLPRVVDAIADAESVLVFTNTRSQTEIWFQALLEARPDWAGQIALHHGSLDRRNREVVEELLRTGRMKCVVCTSSLDLGVDFTPVDRVIQIGSPKGIARLMQRAGRSGHQPGRKSRILCVPTNGFELVEIAAVREAVRAHRIEPRQPVRLPLDLLVQHAVTLAVGEGFVPDALFDEVRTTHAFRELTREQWGWVMDFITRGGPALTAYPEYRRVEAGERFRVTDRTIARRHRMNVGTITSDASLLVKYQSGETIGTIEERFIARLKRGDRFIFAGRMLEYLRMRDMTVMVRRATRKAGPIPQWMGGRMPLSTELGQAVRAQLDRLARGESRHPETDALAPLLELQSRWSRLPRAAELLVEMVKTREGHHLFLYPFEGHRVHEGLAALLAHRLSRGRAITFSISVNDYGLELLSNQPIPFREALEEGLLDDAALSGDILASMNATEMARRQFREIARVAGLVFQGYPGSQKSVRQLQASSGLLFDVFRQYDPDNLLLDQAMREVLDNQLEQRRLKAALARMHDAAIVIAEPPYPTPLAFPILASRIRARLSSEKLADRLERMQLRLEKAADRTSSPARRRSS